MPRLSLQGHGCSFASSDCRCVTGVQCCELGAVPSPACGGGVREGASHVAKPSKPAPPHPSSRKRERERASKRRRWSDHVVITGTSAGAFRGRRGRLPSIPRCRRTARPPRSRASSKPRNCSVSALNERLAMAIAVGLRSRISAHHLSTSSSSFVVRHHRVDEAHVERLLGAVAAAEVPDLARALLADEPRQIGGAEARIDRAHFGSDLPEHRLLGRDGEIAQCRQHVAAADREALHARDHRLRHVADERLHLVDRQADRAAARRSCLRARSGRRRCRTRGRPRRSARSPPTDLSQPARRNASISSSQVCGVNALYFSGRLMVMRATASRTS